jgi:hypothetical protein
MIMHHNALYTPCIALVNCVRLLHILIDPAKPKTEIQAVQVQWIFGGPQASNRDEANIVVINTSPGASNHYP